MSGSLQQLAVGQQQGHVGGLGSYETVQHFNDIKEHLHVVKRNVEHIIQKNAVRSRDMIYVLLHGPGIGFRIFMFMFMPKQL